MSDRIWTISNALSLLRVFLVAPIVVLLLSDSQILRWWAIVIMIFAAFTDALDGYIARRRKEETAVGRIIDPLADKVGVVAVSLVLTIQGLIPLWFLITVSLRDLLILSGGIYLKSRLHLIPASSWAGKNTVALIALVLILAAIPVEGLTEFIDYLLWICAIMLLISLASYVKKFNDITSGRRAG